MIIYPIFTARELAHFMSGFSPNTEFVVIGNPDGSLTISAKKSPFAYSPKMSPSDDMFTQADKDFLAQLNISVDVST